MNTHTGQLCVGLAIYTMKLVARDAVHTQADMPGGKKGARAIADEKVMKDEQEIIKETGGGRNEGKNH
jgi:hypothetical protein